MNLYWTVQTAFAPMRRTALPTFTQHERNEYERRYGAFVAGQNQRNTKPVMPSAIEPWTICWGMRASAGRNHLPDR